MRWLTSLRWRLFGSYMLISLLSMLLLLLISHVITQGEVLATAAAVISAASVSLYLSQRLIRPLQQLSAASQRIAMGSYHTRVEVGYPDELATLSQQMNQLAQALEQTEQRRMALLTDVAHELRTPIMTIDSYAEGMIDGIIPVEPASLTLIQRETARMKRLVEDLALLSRAEAGQLPVNMRPVDLIALIDYLVTQIGSQCEEEGLQLHVDLPQNLPLVQADLQRIEQVLINVLVNAIRYTPAGGTIRISAERHATMVCVAVHDTGIGIAPENLPLIFERFYRTDSSRLRHSGGVGVGLTIARHLMHAQHGEIWAESPGIDAGTIFFISLTIAH